MDAVRHHSRQCTPLFDPCADITPRYASTVRTYRSVAHPDKVDAAYSSSGVVNAIRDFTLFDTHVAGALASPGDSDCGERLADLTRAMESEFAAGRGEAVKRVFGATNLVGTTHGDADFW